MGLALGEGFPTIEQPPGLSDRMTGSCLYAGPKPKRLRGHPALLCSFSHGQ